MAYSDWSWEFFAECAATFAEVEKKLTNEQLQYLRQYYTMNKYPRWMEVEKIAKQWNIEDFDFNSILMRWFSGRRMTEIEAIQRRFEGTKAAA